MTKLAVIIKEKGFSKKELAEIMGISYRNMNYFVNDINERKAMRVKTAVKLAYLLDMTVEELLTCEEEEK